MNKKFLSLFLLLLEGCANKSAIPTPKEEVHEQQVEPNSRSDVLSTISEEEQSSGIKPGLLQSIAMVESGCNPHAVNVGGKGYRFKTQREAAEFIKKMVRAGRTNLSVGCLQLHYRSHRKNFASDEEMLSLKRNVSYGATFLKELHNKNGSWDKAVKRYHSKSPKRGNAYYRKVMRAQSKI